jgi:hypothetical protein
MWEWLPFWTIRWKISVIAENSNKNFVLYYLELGLYNVLIVNKNKQ